LLSLIRELTVKGESCPARFFRYAFDVLLHRHFHTVSEVIRYELHVTVDVPGHRSLSTSSPSVVTLPF
jgi:hypothetical protein